jgi:hypothetical protein
VAIAAEKAPRKSRWTYEHPFSRQSAFPLTNGTAMFYTLPTYVRQTPRPMLRAYLDHLGILADLPLDGTRKVSAAAIVDVLAGLDDATCARIDAVFQDIHSLADRHGTQLILDEMALRAPDLGEILHRAPLAGRPVPVDAADAAFALPGEAPGRPPAPIRIGAPAAVGRREAQRRDAAARSPAGVGHRELADPVGVADVPGMRKVRATMGSR